uniref:Hpt domain-containing protein n=1 Tax=Pseudarthrobacter oxydans TaxID=1671 RepID=UPI003F4961B0
MIAGEGPEVPLLDEFVVTRLDLELDGGGGIWRVFVQDFLAALPGRTDRLRQALTSGDTRGAMVVVQSLRTSSQMVGAERLAGVALDLEQSLRDVARASDTAAALLQLAVDQLPRIGRAAAQTAALLASHLHGGRYRLRPQGRRGPAKRP